MSEENKEEYSTGKYLKGLPPVSENIRKAFNITYDYQIKNDLLNLIDYCNNDERLVIELKNFADRFGLSAYEIIDLIRCNSFYTYKYKSLYEEFEKLTELRSFESVIRKQNISSIKKKIKYCKNPMEKKKLQQELNKLFKKEIDYNKLVGKIIKINGTCGDVDNYTIVGIKSYEEGGIWLTLDSNYIYECFITYKSAKLILKGVEVISYVRKCNLL